MAGTTANVPTKVFLREIFVLPYFILLCQSPLFSSELKREKMQGECLLSPIIIAEKDREMLRQRYRMLRYVNDNDLKVDLNFYHNKRYLDASVPLF